MNPQADFISNLRTLAQQMLRVRAGFKPLREQAYAQGYPANLNAPSAFAGSNADLAQQDVTNLFTALDAVEAVMSDPATHAPTANAVALIKFAGNLGTGQ